MGLCLRVKDAEGLAAARSTRLGRSLRGDGAALHVLIASCDWRRPQGPHSPIPALDGEHARLLLKLLINQEQMVTKHMKNERLNLKSSHSYHFSCFLNIRMKNEKLLSRFVQLHK